jgi:hypothetical protein
MGLDALVGVIKTPVIGGLVKGGLGAKQAWSLGAVSGDAALAKTIDAIDDLIDKVPTDDNTKLLLKYLVRLADDYSTCIVDAGGDPKKAAQKLLARKGVHLVQLLGGTTQEELVELVGALGEFLIALPDRLRLMRLGGLVGAVAGVGLIANDLVSVGNGSRYLQRKWYEAFMQEVTVRQMPVATNPRKGPQLRAAP